MQPETIPLRIFRDPRAGQRSLDLLYDSFLRSGGQFPPDRLTIVLAPLLERSSDPDLALTGLLRFSDATVSKTTLFSTLIQYPVQADLLLRLLGSSRYFADILVREPGLFSWLNTATALTTPVTQKELGAEIERVFDTFAAHQKRLDGLKRLLRRLILRIGAQDILGHADMAGATRQLSLVADALVDAVIRITSQQLAEQGVPPVAMPFAVVGLGKLGGEELNYSSDIDVIFVYAEETEEDAEGGHAHGYFNRLAERLVQNLTGVTPEGYLYRVDTRLRPESGAGPLARSVAGYLTYYESRGELWERQMLIKARPIAGDVAFGEEFLRLLEPFVYPRTFFEHPGQSIARIKARIEASVGSEQNIKLMAGGIRDIEFIAQTLQLVNGGKEPGVREKNTLRALDILSAKGYLTGEELSVLRDAYILYRTLEHRLQMVMNQQTHTLPDDEDSFVALARRSGFESAEELRGTLDRHFSSVREISRRVLGAGSGTPAADLLAAVEGGLTEPAVHQALGPYRFSDPRAAGRALRFLTAGTGLTGARNFDRSTKEAFRDVAVDVFDEIGRTPVPDQTLGALVQVAGEQEFAGIFYKQLRDPRFRRLMLTVCSVSPRFARGLARDPLLMDSVAGDPAALQFDAEHLLLDPRSLHRQKEHLELRAGIRYILGLSTLELLTTELSAVAGGVISAVAGFTAEGVSREELPLALFALGKLGTRELGFDADCDLVFVCSGTESIEPCERRGMAILSELGEVTPRGRLYETDTRLRPEGKNAPLVGDIDGYSRYLTARASLWERQSLTRLRWIGGDATVGRSVTSMVAAYVYGLPLPSGWVDSIVDMRRKMETRSRTRQNAFVDVKLGPGGMADVEFLGQMIQLRYGGIRSALQGLTTRQILNSPDNDVLDAGDREALSEAYAFYRRIETQMKISLEERGSILPTGESLRRLALYIDGSDGAHLLTRVQKTMDDTRARFLRLANRLKE